MGPGARRVAAGTALAALGLLVGSVVFVAARDEPAPPTTTSTTASTAASREVVVEAVADGLHGGLSVPVTREEARCLAEGLVDIVPIEALDALVERDEPLTGVHPDDRAELVRVVVGCLPEASAATLLGRATTTTALTGLPDEG